MSKKKIKTYIARAGYADVGRSPGNYAYKVKTSVISEDEVKEYIEGQYSDNAEEEYDKIIRGKKVAIVGPAKILKGAGLGEKIDSYDTVIRMNGFFDIEPEFYKDYGKKCDILYINGSTGKNAAYMNPELLIYPKKAIGIRKTNHVLCYSILPLEDWRERGLKILSKVEVDDSIMENNANIIVRRTRHVVAGTVFQKSNADTKYKFKQLPLIGPTIIGEVCEHGPAEVYVTGFDFYVNGISWIDGYAGKVKRTGGHKYAENAEFMQKMINDGKIKVDDNLLKIINNIVSGEFKHDSADMVRQGKQAMKASVKK
jgi:hypothetical protein